MKWVVNIAISGLMLSFCIRIVTSKILEYSGLDYGDYGSFNDPVKKQQNVRIPFPPLVT